MNETRVFVPKNIRACWFLWMIISTFFGKTSNHQPEGVLDGVKWSNKTMTKNMVKEWLNQARIKVLDWF